MDFKFKVGDEILFYRDTRSGATPVRGKIGIITDLPNDNFVSYSVVFGYKDYWYINEVDMRYLTKLDKVLK